MKPHIWGVSRSRVLVFLLFIITLMIAGISSAVLANKIQSATKNVILNDDGCIIEMATTKEETVKDVLNYFDIKLGPGDEIEPALDNSLEKQTEISILRASKISVFADGEEETVYIVKGTVEDALKKADVLIREKDTVNYNTDEKALPGMEIRVTRFDEKVIIEKETIPFNVISRKNNSMDEGAERVVQEGSEGELERTILVSYRNGEEISREQTEEKVTIEPVTRIIEKGTVKTTTTSRGDVIRYSQKKRFQATAYSNTIEECGSANGITASGKRVKPYHTIAAPKGIPFGTKVYIPQLVEFWKKRGVIIDGIFVVEDRGSGIRGDKIDVFMSDTSTCRQFGRKNVDVYFIK